jgi:hypothetical protein
MKNKIFTLLTLTLLLFSSLSSSPKVFAAATQTCGSSAGQGIISARNLPQPCANQNTLNNVMNIIFVIVGAISVLMVVIAGFRYIRAGSNETVVAESRRQLVHALVGLIVVVSAAAIVNFVLDRVG